MERRGEERGEEEIGEGTEEEREGGTVAAPVAAAALVGEDDREVAEVLVTKEEATA